ncbi:polysaccharide deacetylase family protein [Azospirillum cavernae]|uniref:Chitooligosaccharide deacetylase n=2 Tax=Azospirillum cavernae TaxID=2320860 RepID=A0A418W2H6_9PROT|nr:polysaccharide deacetylase family protein [Azospirillum cavernae]
MGQVVALTLLGSLLALPAFGQTRGDSKPPSASSASSAKSGKSTVAKASASKTSTADRKAVTKVGDGKATLAKGAASVALPAAATAPATTAPIGKTSSGRSLQLGLFSRESDAWYAWESLQRRQPELTRDLKAGVSFLDGKTEASGAVLRAATVGDVDAQRLCRRIVGAGFGCLIVDAPAVSTVATTGMEPAKAATPQPPAATAPVTATAPVSTITVPVAKIPPSVPVPASAPAVSLPPAAVPATATPPAAPPSPATPIPPSAIAQAPATGSLTPSALAPISAAQAAPLAPPPGMIAATPPPEGTVIYTEEDARTMADIEQHSRSKGRLRSVMPDSRLDVMPATLKREGWNLCALTFDDGPHRTVTRQVLDVLNREKVPATYFPVGRVAQHQGDLIRDFIASGHEIGNHSLTHSDLRPMGVEAQRYEIAETNRILRSFGANPVLFRPPYGRYSNELLGVARAEQMSSVLWTVDTRDWKVRNADKIVEHIRTAAGIGSVFLMHSTYASTAEALPRVIAELRNKGCEFVTLSEWLERMRTLALPKIVNAGMPSPAPTASTPPAARN